jgi:hypothetical protein
MDLDLDPWMKRKKKEGGGAMNTRKQWHRLIDQVLLPNDPRVDDGLDIVVFNAAAKGGDTRFATRADWLHCGIRAVWARGPRRDDPTYLATLLRDYKAGTDCAKCRPAPVPEDAKA